jgi:DNA polymerase-3 subunit beta
MKILCDREKLKEGLALANNVIPTKSPKPALSNVCLVATEGALELVGTDLEVSLRYRIEDVKVEEPGTAVIPARVAGMTRAHPARLALAHHSRVSRSRHRQAWVRA